jgi:hypothetical protein
MTYKAARDNPTKTKTRQQRRAKGLCADCKRPSQHFYRCIDCRLKQTRQMNNA